MFVAALAAWIPLSCAEPILGGRSRLARVSIEPRFSARDAAIYRSLKTFGLGVTTVHVTLRRLNQEAGVLAEETVTLAEETPEFTLTLTVPIEGNEERLIASIQMFSGQVLVFSGSVEVLARLGALPTSPPVLAAIWVGPGVDATSIRISPRDLALAVNGRLTFTAVATNSAGAPITDPDFTTRWRWRVSDSTLGSIPPNGGEFVAAGATGVVLLTVTTPNLLRDTVRITIANQLPLASVRFERQVEVLSTGATAAAVPVSGFDANGTLVNVAVRSYVSRSPGIATVNPTTGAITGAAKGQAVIVVRGQDQGATAFFEDSLLAVVAEPDGPVVLSGIDRFEYGRDATITVGVLVDMRSATQRLGSTTIDVDWNPGVLQYVSHGNGASGVSPTVNATNAGQGRVTLAMADVTGFAGRVELLRITFRTSATATVGQLALTARELSAANFADLLAASLQVTHPISIR